MCLLNVKFRLLAGMVALVLSGMPNPSYGHGSLLIPESRIHYCRFGGNPENHSDPACKAAIKRGGTQPVYDWNAVRQGDADGRHRKIIPDGQLCSGGNTTFRGLDLPRADWRATSIVPDSNGRFEFIYQATAPHATKDMVFYMTRDGWDPSQPFGWNDVDEICRFGSVPLTIFDGKNVYRMSCDLPPRSGRHVIFHIWQRSDSPEAFYACSDVVFNGAPDGDLRPIGRLTAADRLPVGTRITFRLLDENSMDLERIEMIVAENQDTPDLWAFYLAQVLNSQSQFIRVGVLSGEGSVNPTRTLNGNIVYNLTPRDLTFVIDKQVPDQSEPPVDPEDPDSGGFDFLYPEGRGEYRPGTVVKGSDGNRYQCRPFPNSGWCNQAPFHYAPVTGQAWSEAWIHL